MSGEHLLQSFLCDDDDTSAVIDTAFGGDTKLVYCCHDATFRKVAMQPWRSVSTPRQKRNIYELHCASLYADSVSLQIIEKTIKCGGKRCFSCKPQYKNWRASCREPTSLYYLLGPKQGHVMNSALEMIATTVVDRSEWPDNAHLYVANAPKHKAATKRQQRDDQYHLSLIEKEINGCARPSMLPSGQDSGSGR